MKLARLLALVAVAACASGRRQDATLPAANETASSAARATQGTIQKSTDAQPPSSTPLPETPVSTVDLGRERTLVDESEAARKASDYDMARAKAGEAVTSLLARPESEQDAAWLALLNSAGQSAWDAQDTRTANAAWQRVFDVRSRTLPDDHPDLQRARFGLARTLLSEGDLAGARELFAKVLEVRLRTLPDDHPQLQAARQALAATMYSLGDLEGARSLQEVVLAALSRTLPDDHPQLQTARLNLAATIAGQGDLAGARSLEEKVLEVRARTLPDDHPDLQQARLNLAATLKELGDYAEARALGEKVLEIRSRLLPRDHPNLQLAQQNLAATMHEQGDFAGARAILEDVVEVESRTLPDDHPYLQAARQNLAATIQAQGDLAGARALEEQVLSGYERALPDDHPDLQRARQNLATTEVAMGDLAGAQPLFEKVLEVRSRALPDDHPDLQAARVNLALAIKARGDLPVARALEEKVVEVLSRTLPDEHTDLQRARLNLAVTVAAQGDLASARLRFEMVLEVLSRTLPADHPFVQMAGQDLAATMYSQGDFAGARTLQEKVLEFRSRTLPSDHPDLQAGRANLAATIVCQLARAGRASGAEGENAREKEEGRERCADLIRALCRAQVGGARDAILGSSGREAEERCSSMAKRLDTSLSFARGYGMFERLPGLEAESFLLSETTRGAAVVSAQLTRMAATAPKYGELRGALREASNALAGLAQKGTTSEEFDRARTKRELAERDLVALAREMSGGKPSGVELDVESLAARLAEREAAVGFRRFAKSTIQVVEELDSGGQPAVRETSVDSLCAFVVRSPNVHAQPDAAATSTLKLVDLGPTAPIEEAVRAWRDGLGIGSDSRGLAGGVQEESRSCVVAQGSALREKVFDPLLPALAGAQRIVIALDDVLHLVPLDVLPLDETTLLGDRWQIETRATLMELVQIPEPLKEPGQFVAFGDVEYGPGGIADESGGAVQFAAAEVQPRANEAAGILRGSAWSGGFPAIPGTGDEVRGIARCFADQFGGDATPELCDHASATRERLLSLAPQARWLHIATHGWFAPESIRSWSDREPLDKQTGLGTRLSGQEQVRGMSPMLLCGLAFAGANLPETATGRVPGLVTAEELSTLDLTHCELVVLSACDTNVGERRAGQGVASLQKALHMAGARAVITSLWKVPDEATKDLMLDFYRRLWIEKKPKWQALWEAKMKLRNAKDERGRPCYTTRDWAAWILTGDPN